MSSTGSHRSRSPTKQDERKYQTGKRHQHRQLEYKKKKRPVLPRSQVKKYVYQGGGYLCDKEIVKLANQRLKKRTKEFQKKLSILCAYTKRKQVDTEMVQLAYYYWKKGPLFDGTLWGQFNFDSKTKSTSA